MPGAAALMLALVATVIAGIQLFRPGFSPSSAGGFGSVFVGFMVFYALHMLAGAYWIETQWCSVRARRCGPSCRRPSCTGGSWRPSLAIFSILFYVV